MVEEVLILNKTQQSELFMDKLTTTDYILDKVDFGVVPITYITDKFINQFGSTVMHNNVSERTIEIIGNIIAPNVEEMTARKMYLNKMFNVLDNFSAVYKNYTIDFRLENSIKYTVEERTNNEVVCNFKINAIAHYPLFLENEKTENVVAGYSSAFHFPLILNADLRNENPPPTIPQYGVVFGRRNMDSKVAIIANKGDVNVGMTFIIKAVRGSVTNPKITNVLTGEFFEINKTLSDGEIIIVNTEIGKKNIIGSTDGGQTYSNYFAYKSLDSTWISLRPGANSLEYEATSGEDNLQIDLEFNSAFMEVQECF